MNKKIISEKALLHNIDFLKKTSGSRLFCAVVKANAYGHGALNVALKIAKIVDYFAVANLEEAQSVLKLKTKKPILVLTPVLKPKIEPLIEFCVCCEKDIEILEKQKKEVFVHLKINTGMNRFGCNKEEAKLLVNKIDGCKFVKLKGVFTHFGITENDNLLKKQATLFQKIIDDLNLPKSVIVHASNTAASLKGFGFDMCRCGIGIYGFGHKNLMPALKIISKIVQINKVEKGEFVGYGKIFKAKKKMFIAVVKIGYADGFERQFGFGFVKIRGQLCKVVGSVCMDCLFCDVSDLNVVSLQDDVLVLGEEISVLEIAKKTKKIPYEILCNFNNLR